MILSFLNNKRKTEDIASSYRRVFESPDGKIVLDHLAQIVGLDTINALKTPTVNEIMFFEGQKRVILHILNMLNITVYNYLKMKSNQVINEDF